MRPIQRLVSAAVLIALSSALTGCGSMTGWDPSDLLDFLDTKKKLPGDRKPVFPEGVPGLQQGVPRELYRGAQTEQAPQAPVAAAPAEEPKGRKAKSRANVNVGAVRSAPAAETPADPDAGPVDEGGTNAAPPAPKGKITRRRTTAPPPDQSAAPQAAPAQQAQPGSAFPAPVPSGTFTR
ncbi:MAG: hypothetical protein JWR89_1601 [Tardiphaga sp.]|jgi:hypothetical protein|uniref:hypothetical protein n=1 Tax=Tardiphaga sp. TaxID=1926292 RepID=UPI00261666CA|nr:hypothetical protein [Tardiphaga sp.]MDB5501699.1 hypothetical protein [Tardiphaga sp.]